MNKKMMLMLTILLIFIAGCPHHINSGSYDLGNDAAPTTGIRYYASKDILQVNSTVTYSIKWKVKEDLEIDELPVKFQSATATINLRTVPDSRRFFMLDFRPSSNVERNFNVAVSDDGLLTSINALSTDKTGEVVTNIAKATASVVGIAAGLPFSSKDIVTPDAVSDLFRKTGRGSFLYAAHEKVDNDPRATRDQKEKAKKQYENALQQFRQTPLPTLAYLKASQHGVLLWDKRLELDANIEGLRSDKKMLLKDATRQKAKAAIDLINEQIKAIDSALTLHQSERDAVAQVFQVGLDQFKAEMKLDETKVVKNYVDTFQLSDLPQQNTVFGSSQSEIKTNLGTCYTAMSEFYERTHIVLTLDGMPASVKQRQTADFKGKDGVVQIYYREAYPGTIGIFIETQSEDPSEEVPQLRKIDEKLQQVIHPDAPLLCATYDEKTFTNQNMQLTFNRQGRLTGIIQTSSASLAGATSAVSSAISGARDEVVASLKKMEEFQETQQKMKLNKVASRVDLLKKQKDKIDAELALEGTTASRDLITQKQQVDAELALLESQVKLSKATGTSDLDIDNALLKAKVDNMQAQIELLTKQVQLQNLKQNP